jgi:hypothetical protein
MTIKSWHLLIPLAGFVGIFGGSPAAADTPEAVDDSAVVAPGDTTAHMDFERLRDLPGAYHKDFQKALREGRFRPAGRSGVIVKAPRFGMPILVPNPGGHSMPSLWPHGLFEMPQLDPYSNLRPLPPLLRTTPFPRDPLPSEDDSLAKDE